MGEPFTYVVLIGLLLLVAAALLPKKRGDGKEGMPDRVLKDMEETMEGFLAELEDDNRKLLDTIAAMKQEYEASNRKLTERVEGLEKLVQEQRLEWHRLALERMEKQESALRERASSAPAEPPAAPGSEEPSERLLTIRSRYEDLFRMHEEGKSVEYIAKKTGMNKGEISLIIQLAGQEER